MKSIKPIKITKTIKTTKPTKPKNQTHKEREPGTIPKPFIPGSQFPILNSSSSLMPPGPGPLRFRRHRDFHCRRDFRPRSHHRSRPPLFLQERNPHYSPLVVV